MRPSTLPRLLLSTLLAAGTPLLAQADTPIATFTTDLSNLGIQLIDLAPDDGIAPGFTLDMEYVGLDVATGAMTLLDGGPIGGLLPSQPVSHASPDGSLRFSTTPNSLRTTATVTLEQALAAVGDLGGGQAGARLSPVGQILSARAGSSALGEIQLPRITLTANTRMVISGNASYAGELDATALGAWLPGSGYTGFTLSETQGTFSLAAIQFIPEGATPGEWTEGDTDTFVLARPSGFDPTGHDLLAVTQADPGGVGSGASGTFAIHFSNTGSSALTLDIALTTIADPQLQLLLHQAAPHAVPEPGTWALMGLGLAGIALATRRRA